MDHEQSHPNEDAGVDTSEAEQPSSQGGTEEGGASSVPAEKDTLSAADAMVEGFLKEYGEEKEDAPKEEEASDETEPEPEEESDPERDQSADEKVRLTAEEYNALPTKAKQRIGYLSAETKRFKSEVETLTSQVEDYRDGHEAITKLREFSTQNNLRSEDVTNGLHIMARLQKGDFDGFLTDVMPFVQMAQQATGKALSPEIQQLVDDGEITEAAAQRMTKAEVQSKLAEQSLSREREASQQRDARESQGRALQAMQRAVAETEASLKTSDPDYALKSQAILAQFEMMLQRGAVPKSPEDAAEMVRAIHKTVQVSRPQLRATPPRPNATTAHRRSAAPSSPREAVFAALTDGSV